MVYPQSSANDDLAGSIRKNIASGGPEPRQVVSDDSFFDYL